MLMLDNMIFKRFFRYVCMFFLTLLLASGCVNIKKIQQIEMGNVKVEGVSRNGMRGMTLNLSVEVDNPAPSLELTEISGLLENSGKVLGRFALDPLTLQGKTTCRYHVKADLTLGEGASILDLGRLMDKRTLEACTVDLNANVRIGKGRPRNIRLDDVPVKKLLDTLK